MIKMYKVLIVTAIICIAFGIFKRPRKMKVKNFSKESKENILLMKLDKIINKSNYLSQVKEKYISKLQLINFKNYKYNNVLIVKYVAIDALISLLLLIALFNIITMWYAALTISAVCFQLIIMLGENYIKYRIDKIHRQFTEALKCFLDEYIINKNIKNAINNSYNKMPKEIGGAFEMLARELSGEKNYETTIKKFANELSYVWGHSFAEFLISSYEGAGDVTEELMMLNKLISEEITAEEEEKSSRFENKLTFIVIYFFALVGIIINILKNNLARYLYFYTDTGNALIAAWLIILIVKIAFTSLTERGR